MLLLEFLLDNVNVRWWPGPSSIVAHFDCSPRHGDTDAVVRIQRRFVCVCVCVHASRVCVCMLCMRACRPNTIPKSVFLYIYMCVWSVSLMWMAAWKLFAGMTQCTHAPMVRRAYSVTQWKQCASFANFNVLSTQKVFMTDICFVYHQMQIVEGYLPKGPCLTPLPIVPRRSNEILGKLLVTSTKGFFVNIVESSPGIQDILRMVDDGFFCCCCFQWTIRVKISSVLVDDHNGAPCQPTYIQLNWCLFFFLLLFVLHTAHLMHAYNGTKSNNIDSQLRIQFRFDIKHSGMRSIKKRTINENWRVLGWFSI